MFSVFLDNSHLRDRFYIIISFSNSAELICKELVSLAPKIQFNADHSYRATNSWQGAHARAYPRRDLGARRRNQHVGCLRITALYIKIFT